MPSPLEHQLDRWLSAGLLDAASAQRIRDYEASRASHPRLRWPIVVALAAGGIMLAAGILLFVAANWDQLSPSARFGLVLGMVAACHIGAAFAAAEFPGLATTLHAVGTATLGAGIFLAGQIFNLESHWPTAVLLWAIGAWAAWALLRDWPQLALAAVLTPAWLVSEWVVAARLHQRFGESLAVVGLLYLAIVYLSAEQSDRPPPARSALAWIGALAFFPLAILVAFNSNGPGWIRADDVPVGLAVAGWLGALGVPSLVAVRLHEVRKGLPLLAAGLWALIGAVLGHRGLLPFLWGMAGSLGLVAWGVFESGRRRINLGMAGIALTVVLFYFSNVMDRMGRAGSLMLGGLLFLAGGWALERLRRRLVARIVPGARSP